LNTTMSLALFNLKQRAPKTWLESVQSHDFDPNKFTVMASHDKIYSHCDACKINTHTQYNRSNLEETIDLGLSYLALPVELFAQDDEWKVLKYTAKNYYWISVSHDKERNSYTIYERADIICPLVEELLHKPDLRKLFVAYKPGNAVLAKLLTISNEPNKTFYEYDPIPQLGSLEYACNQLQVNNPDAMVVKSPLGHCPSWNDMFSGSCAGRMFYFTHNLKMGKHIFDIRKLPTLLN